MQRTTDTPHYGVGRDMSVVFFLIKFFDNEDHGRDFVSGMIYANTLATFKRLEGVDDSGRGDRNEGTIAWLQPGQGRLEINGMDITDDLAGPTQLQKNWLNHLRIFCLHGVHSGSLDIANVSNENIEELRKQFTIPDECRALGKHAVVVNDVPEFINRMEAAAQGKGCRIARGLVRYYDPESFHGGFRDVESIFHKQDRHSYQREFRFVIDTGLVSDDPRILEIGDISDITRWFDFAELNGKEFLGGDMAMAG